MPSNDQWQGCYDIGWGKNLIPEAFSHPAKVSFSLAGKIYDHAINMRWVKRGDFVLDPFSGIAGFGFHALCYGLNWIGIELEQKFVFLGEQNIELWNRQLKGWPNLGTARIVQGDSRRLRELIYRNRWRMNPGLDKFGFIPKADLVVSSPPFLAETGRNPAYCDGKSNFHLNRPSIGKDNSIMKRADYGHTPGNLANMREGNIDLVVSSPPYAKSINSGHDGIDFSKAGRPDKMEKTSTKHYPIGAGADRDFRYGQSPGQLGSMKEGSFDMCVSSPPFSGSMVASCDPKYSWKFHGEKYADSRVSTRNQFKYMSPEWLENRKRTAQKQNLGRLPEEAKDPTYPTFWSASREIVQGCYELLKDGSHAIWVCKDYVKKGQRVPFTDRWLSLCESVGFRLVCRHQAMLVKDHGTQITMNGEEKIQTERKSFFRRLAESKGSPRIDEEDIICLKKE